MNKKQKLKTVGITPDNWERLKLMALNQHITLAQLISDLADKVEALEKVQGNEDGNGAGRKA
jgi:predicted DNA-binding ribbon-helix-helix protein